MLINRESSTEELRRTARGRRDATGFAFVLEVKAESREEPCRVKSRDLVYKAKLHKQEEPRQRNQKPKDESTKVEKKNRDERSCAIIEE